MYTATDVANLIGGVLEGDGTIQLYGFAGIEQAKSGDLTFLANMKYEPFIYTTQASAVLVEKSFAPKQPCTTTLIRVSDPYEALSQLMRLYVSQQDPQWTGVHPTATIDPSVQIPEECIIGPYVCIDADVQLGMHCIISSHCVIGSRCAIGDETTLYPRVTLYADSIIGHHCRIHAGTVIGADGFGYAPTEHGYDKIPQIGHVVIGDYVEIGANSCIDRATMGVTRIASGVKIDNLVQIAHNCTVDEHTVIAAQAGLAGSAHIKEWCQLGGQVGVAGHLTVGAHSHLAGKTGVLGNLKPHSMMMGAPAMPVGKALRAFAVLPKLPEVICRLEKLEAHTSTTSTK